MRRVSLYIGIGCLTFIFGVLVAVFNDVQAVRIFWTDGDNFWSVQAPSLELARQFEESSIVHSIVRSNRAL